MGMVYTEVTLKNVGDIELVRRGYIKEAEVRELTVTALVDTGAFSLCITEDVFSKLGLDAVGQTIATVANGQSVVCKITAPVDVHWRDRSTTVRATVVPGSEKILLGAIPLEGMDLTVSPKTQEVIGAHGDETVFYI